MTIHYNALKNADAEREKPKVSQVSDALLVINNVCSATNRPPNTLSNIYLPPAEIAGVLDAKGVSTTDRVVRHQLFPRESGVQSIKSTDLKHMPGRVSIGDISSDGFPDIMLTMRYDNGTEQAQILLNSPCNKKYCGPAAKDSKRRMFSKTSNAIEKFLADDEDFDDGLLNSVLEGRLERLNFTDFGDDYKFMGEEFASHLTNFTSVQYAVFFDLMEDSSVDILLVRERQVAQRDEPSTYLQAVYNNIDISNFFIKVRMITDELVANSVSSASYRCVITQLNDKKIVVAGGASGQGAYHGLQTPFTFIGMGRSNNFIEEFSVAVFSEGKRSLRTWTPVIPKTVLFVIADMSEQPEAWNLTLLLNPTDKIPLILITDGVFLLGLGLVIIVFHMYEKVSQRFERSQQYLMCL